MTSEVLHPIIKRMLEKDVAGRPECEMRRGVQETLKTGKINEHSRGVAEVWLAWISRSKLDERKNIETVKVLKSFISSKH